jgi:hypothetical protein
MSAPNLALRFTLELCALAALGFWGAHFDASWVVAFALAILAPMSAAVAWGLFVSPKARFKLPATMRLAVELGVFLAGAGGLFAAGQIRLALAFAATVVFHEIWRGAEFIQRAR